MTEIKISTGVPLVVLRTRPALDMDDEQFFEFCQQNKDWRIERTAEGDLEILPPTGFETSDRNSELNTQLRSWAKQDGKGVTSESSGGFVLTNGTTRSPDAAWIRRERLTSPSTEQKQRYLPLCPDFVVEIRSLSDPLPPLEAKMREYVENGARLGWLLDPEARSVHVHKQDGTVETVSNPDMVSGDPVLPGFVLDLRPVWEPDL